MDVEIIRLVTYLFKELNNSKTNYCILRNYEELPNNFGNDIDILFEKEDSKNIISKINKISSFLEWQSLCIYNHNAFITIVCFKVIDNKFTQLKLDIWTDLLWRGMRWIDTKYILNNKIMYNGFYIPSPGTEAAVTLLKEIMGKGTIPKKYYKKIQVMLKNDEKKFHGCLSHIYGNYTDTMYSDCINDKWDNINLSEKKIKKMIINFSRINYNHKELIKFLHKELKSRINSILKPKGLLIAFVGPDGSGKSIIIKNISHKMKIIFPIQRTFHTRLEIFPEIKTGLGLSNKKKKEKSNKENINVQYSITSKLVSWLVIAYYTFEFVIGKYLINKTKRKNGIVFFDRYYYDFFAQPTTRNLIWKLRKVLLFFVPKPDIIFHLVADAEIIYDRKKELNIEEINKQNTYLKKLLKENKNCIEIDTNNNMIEEKVNDMCIILIKKFNENKNK